jgi:ribosome-associated toxin RatA of RatAB toxin-antitoxin module
MAEATRSIEIDAPVEKVFQVITDYDHYAEFLPEVRRIRTSDRKGNEVKVHYELEVVKTIKYTLKMQEHAPNRVQWTFVEGEFMKDNRGSWTLEPAGEGKTKATYAIEMKLGALVPNTIVKALVETSLPKMLQAFKRRAEGR